MKQNQSGTPQRKNNGATGLALLQEFTRDSNYVRGLTAPEGSAGKTWDGRFVLGHIPAYDATKDRFCKFSKKKQLMNRGVVSPKKFPGAVGGLFPPPLVPHTAWKDSPTPLAMKLASRVINQLGISPQPPGQPTLQGNDIRRPQRTPRGTNPNAAPVIELNLETLFTKSKQRLHKLWDEMGISDADRVQFAHYNFQNTTVDGLAVINDEIQRLLDRRNLGINVEKCIEVREGFLYLLQELTERVSSATVALDKDRVSREFTQLSTSLRNASLDTVEAVQKWRSMPGQTEPTFIWKGVSYLTKMSNDLSFLAHSKLTVFADFSLQGNPLLDPRREPPQDSGLPPLRRKPDPTGLSSAHLSKDRLDAAERVLQDEQRVVTSAKLRKNIVPKTFVKPKESEQTIIEEIPIDAEKESMPAENVEEEAWLNVQQDNKKETREHMAALTIQRVYQGFRGRQIAKVKARQRSAAISIQKTARRYLAKKYTTDRLLRYKAAQKIQARQRGITARAQTNQVLRRTAMAEKIQRAYRGYCGRRIANWHRLLWTCSRDIQRVFRGHRCRAALKRWKLSKKDQTATIIQRNWRGHLVRSDPRFNKLKQVTTVKLQAWFRGVLQRKQCKYLANRRNKCRKIQAWWRTRSAVLLALCMRQEVNNRNWEERLNISLEAATKIQASWKMHIAVEQRKVMMNCMKGENALEGIEHPVAVAVQKTAVQSGRERAAAIKIQTQMRGYLARSSVKLVIAVRKKAVDIQRLARGMIARKTTRLMRTEAEVITQSKIRRTFEPLNAPVEAVPSSMIIASLSPAWMDYGTEPKGTAVVVPTELKGSLVTKEAISTESSTLPPPPQEEERPTNDVVPNPEEALKKDEEPMPQEVHPPSPQEQQSPTNDVVPNPEEALKKDEEPMPQEVNPPDEVKPLEQEVPLPISAPISAPEKLISEPAQPRAPPQEVTPSIMNVVQGKVSVLEEIEDIKETEKQMMAAAVLQEREYATEVLVRIFRVAVAKRTKATCATRARSKTLKQRTEQHSQECRYAVEILQRFTRRLLARFVLRHARELKTSQTLFTESKVGPQVRDEAARFIQLNLYRPWRANREALKGKVGSRNMKREVNARLCRAQEKTHAATMLQIFLRAATKRKSRERAKKSGAALLPTREQIAQDRAAANLIIQRQIRCFLAKCRVQHKRAQQKEKAEKAKAALERAALEQQAEYERKMTLIEGSAVEFVAAKFNGTLMTALLNARRKQEAEELVMTKYSDIVEVRVALVRAEYEEGLRKAAEEQAAKQQSAAVAELQRLKELEDKYEALLRQKKIQDEELAAAEKARVSAESAAAEAHKAAQAAVEEAARAKTEAAEALEAMRREEAERAKREPIVEATETEDQGESLAPCYSYIDRNPDPTIEPLMSPKRTAHNDLNFFKPEAGTSPSVAVTAAANEAIPVEIVSLSSLGNPTAPESANSESAAPCVVSDPLPQENPSTVAPTKQQVMKGPKEISRELLARSVLDVQTWYRAYNARFNKLWRMRKFVDEAHKTRRHKMAIVIQLFFKRIVAIRRVGRIRAQKAEEARQKIAAQEAEHRRHEEELAARLKAAQEELQRKLKDGAAAAIQRSVRGYNARFMLRWKKMERVEKLERVSTQERQEWRRKAAVKIQCMVRVFCARHRARALRLKKRDAQQKAATEEQRRHDASIKIQTGYRAYNARFEASWRRESRDALRSRERDVAAAREKDEADKRWKSDNEHALWVKRNKAAIVIQCAFRVSEARFQRRWREEKKKAKEGLPKKQAGPATTAPPHTVVPPRVTSNIRPWTSNEINTAANRIQCAYRQHRARRRAETLRKQRSIESNALLRSEIKYNAARKIQTIFRQHLAYFEILFLKSQREKSVVGK